MHQWQADFIYCASEWKLIICSPVTSHLHTVFISCSLSKKRGFFFWQVTFSLQHHWIFILLKNKQQQTSKKHLDWGERGSDFFSFFLKNRRVFSTYLWDWVCVCFEWRSVMCACLGECGCWQVSLSVCLPINENWSRALGQGEASMFPWRFCLMEIQCWVGSAALRDTLGIKNVLHCTHYHISAGNYNLGCKWPQLCTFTMEFWKQVWREQWDMNQKTKLISWETQNAPHRWWEG